MIRILIVDDEDVTNSHVRKLQEGIAANFDGEQPHVELIRVDSDDSAVLRSELSERAKDHWDALLIDVNLYPDNESLPRLLVPCQLVEEFRKSNQSAMVFIYSGLIEQHLEKIFSLREEEKSKLVERHIRQILALGIAAFSAVNKVVDDTLNRLHNPPPLLLIERELLAHGKRKVRGEVSPLKDKTFFELAAEVRLQSNIGREIVDCVTKHGVSALVDLNT